MKVFSFKGDKESFKPHVGFLITAGIGSSRAGLVLVVMENEASAKVILKTRWGPPVL